MSIKISELPSATSVGENDYVPIVQSGETKKAPASAFGGGGGGTSDYTDLSNKPSINSVTLTGNKTSGDLNLVGTGDIATTIDSTSTNSQVAGAKAVYDATDKSVITIVNSANKEIRTAGNWNTYQVGLDTVYYQSGSKFTLDTTDGSIKIGAGVSRVKATLNYALLGSAAETGVGIRRYSFADGTWTTSRPTSNYTNSAWFPNSFSTITDVQENDKIGMWFNTHTNGTITVNAYGTALTVEELSTGATSTNSTNTLNTASLMNTGSLVGMGDRTELTSLEVADTNVGEIPSEDSAEVTVEEKTVEVEPIATLKEEKESGDTI